MSRSQQTHGGARGGGRSWRQRQNEEHHVQAACIYWCEFMKAQVPELDSIYHINNEGKRSVQGHMAAVEAGLKKGMPDLCLPVRGSGFCSQFNNLFIEIKRPGERPRSEQVERMQLLTDNGNLCLATDDHHVFSDVVSWYLGIETVGFWYVANDFFVIRPKDYMQQVLYGSLPY